MTGAGVIRVFRRLVGWSPGAGGHRADPLGAFVIVADPSGRGYRACYAPQAAGAVGWTGPRLPTQAAARAWIVQEARATETAIKLALRALDRPDRARCDALAEAWLALQAVRPEVVAEPARHSRLLAALEWFNDQVFDGGFDAFHAIGRADRERFRADLRYALHGEAARADQASI